MRALGLTVLLIGCGSTSPTTTSAAPAEERRVREARARYHATILEAESTNGDIEAGALEGTKGLIARELGQTGGVTGGAPPPRDLRSYVFRPSVGEVRAEPTGRTRATVTVFVESDGRIVAALRGTATAYVERSAPLAERQLAAIEGAVQGAFAHLPELVARLEQR